LLEQLDAGHRCSSETGRIDDAARPEKGVGFVDQPSPFASTEELSKAATRDLRGQRRNLASQPLSQRCDGLGSTAPHARQDRGRRAEGHTLGAFSDCARAVLLGDPP
jgi:hypothetical protein